MKKLTLSELNQALKKYIQALPEKKQPLYEKVFELRGYFVNQKTVTGAYWFEDVGAVVYIGEFGSGFFTVTAFSGKRTKPDFNYYVKSAEEVEADIQTFYKRLCRSQAAKIEQRKQNRPTNADVQIGDIFESSWGYEQTNVNYYQVVGYRGKSMVLVREIAANRKETGYFSGVCTPAENCFISDEILIRRVTNGRIKIDEIITAHKAEYQEISGKKVYSENPYSNYY